MTSREEQKPDPTMTDVPPSGVLEFGDEQQSTVKFLAERHREWPKERERWLYVLDTFWQHDPKWMLWMFQQAESLDALVKRADSERGGMVAT